MNISNQNRKTKIKVPIQNRIDRNVYLERMWKDSRKSTLRAGIELNCIHNGTEETVKKATKKQHTQNV